MSIETFKLPHLVGFKGNGEKPEHGSKGYVAKRLSGTDLGPRNMALKSVADMRSPEQHG